MFVKLGALDVLDAWRVPAAPSARAIRKASHRISFSYDPRPGFLYVRSRMISSRCNDNHDEFPAPEIEKAYKSFLGKPVFVNHHNSNHRRARGVIVAIALHRDKNPDGTPDTWVEGLMEIDAQRFPRLAKAIIARRIDRTSMGVDVDYSICSACGNRAESPADYCRHMPAFKGKKIRQRNPETGKLQEEVIREICHGLHFFENSLLVEDPADPTAIFVGDVDQRGLRAVASKKAAALDVPHPGRMQGGTCRENCTYGGTHCLACGEPVMVNLHKADVNGGWHHADSRKRPHGLAVPADPDGVIASVPAQLAARDQARAHVQDALERQGLPRRKADEMPPDPFLAHFRRTADAMDETPGEGRQDALGEILRHLNEAHGASANAALFGAQQMFNKVHGRDINGGYGVKPSEEAPASERVRWQTNWAKTYIDSHKGLHYMHQQMHGHNPVDQGDTWKYPNESGEFEYQGEKRGFNHRHRIDDPLVAHPKVIDPDPENRKWLDPTSDMHFLPDNSRVIWPMGHGTHEIRDYYRQDEGKYSDLHPDRTDEHPNVKKYHDPDDPDTWSNLDACSRVYRGEQRKFPPHRPDISKLPHDEWMVQSEKHRNTDKRAGRICPECGTYKWMHAQFRPSEVGRPTEQYRQRAREYWDENIKGQTGPFVPELPRYSSLLGHFRAASVMPGHFEFFRGLDTPEARPRIDYLKDHLREDHWGSSRAMNELEDEAHGNWQGPARYNEAMHYTGLDRMHRDAHERSISSSGDPEHIRQYLESQHHPYFEREEEDRSAERQEIEEHRESATVRMHGRPASLSDLELHLTGRHGMPAQALPQYRLPTYAHGPDRYASDLEELHHRDHGELGSRRHEDNNGPVHMHGEDRSPDEAEDHLVTWHGYDGPGYHDPLHEHEYPAEHLERLHDEAHEDELDEDEPDEHEDLLTHHGRYPAHETEAGAGAERRLEHYRQPQPHEYETIPDESGSGVTITHEDHEGQEYDPVFGWRHRSVLLAHFRRAVEDVSYRMQHQGPDAEDGEGLHEIGSGKIWPKDFRERWPEYRLGATNESIDKVLDSQDWPSRKVWAYRALPSPHREINPGDWVSTSAEYAREEGRVSSNPDDDYPVVKFQCRAEHLRNEGNSLDEWSYHGPPVRRALVHYSGGANHRGKGPRGAGTDARCDEHEPLEMRREYSRMNAERRRRREEERQQREGTLHLAISGEHAEPGHDIWAVPHGTSPAAEQAWHNSRTREPNAEGEDPASTGNWYRGVSYHGPYHIIRHPQTRETHVVDAQGREAGIPPYRPSYGNQETQGRYGEDAAEQHWHGLESQGPDAHRTGTEREPSFAIMKERTPAFPHSRVDPEDEQRLLRPDARVHKPEGFSPDDEYHGSYEVVRHPETGRFHVVDNAGRSTGFSHDFSTQLKAERSRDYIEKRQRSKEMAKGFAESLWEGVHQVLDPGGTDESRQSDRDLQRGQDLMSRYAGGRGQVKFDPDDEGGEPYYHREHYLPNGNQSGWYTKHYGGDHADIYHHATGDEYGHYLIRFPQHPEDEDRVMVPRLHPDFDDISLGKALRDWHDTAEARTYYETSDSEPRIRRWKQRYPDGRPVPRQASLDAEAAHYEHPSDHPFFHDNPVSSQNISDAYEDSTDDEKNLGRRWYSDAHHVAKAIAGGDAARGAGLVAAYSPRTAWPANLLNASRAHREDRAFGGPGEGAMGMHRNLAAPIIAGVHHSAAFRESAPKIGAFAHLIEHGGDSQDDVDQGSQRVVVDRHALSAAIGRRVTDDDLGRAPLDKPRYYEHVADAYRQAAADLSHVLGQVISPHQIQAVVWLRQLRKNQEEDRELRGGGGRGRVRSGENARDRWRQHQLDTGLDIPEGNMHREGAVMLAYGETSVPPRVRTLRQETCPVCGESEVWTGQRCPICGFTAPPDIFRDPDLSRAMEMRDQAGPEEEGPVPGFPRGPADEQQLAGQQMGSFPDAQAQMFHPDQLAPNGVPAPVPGSTGLNGMPQSPEDEEEQGEQEIVEGEDEEQQGEEDEALGGQEARLGCPACGSSFAPGEQGAQPGESCPACGQAALVPVDDEDDPGKGQDPQEEEDDVSGGKRTASRQPQRAAPHTSRQLPSPPRTAAQAAGMAAFQRVAVLEQENAVLRYQLGFMARLAGCEDEMARIRQQALTHYADLLNPAQPVPDPPQGPPAQTTEEALASGAPTGSGTGMHRGPGHTEDDPSRPGASPGSMTAVPSEKTTTAITPGVEIQTPPANQLLDVTAPIQGTNPSQDGGVPLQQRRIETDVRIDPDPLKAHGPGIGGIGDNGTAYPWYLDARSPQQGAGGAQQRTASARPGDVSAQEAAASERTWASMRLARLRVQAGLVRGDELELAAHIERDASLSLQVIDHEIATLARVAQTRPLQQRRPAQRTATRSAPSLAAPPAPAPYAPAMASYGGYGQGDADSDMFL